MKVTSAMIAATIANRANDIRAAMTVYERLPAQRDSLIASVDHLMECMEWEFAVLRRKREEERVNAQT